MVWWMDAPKAGAGKREEERERETLNLFTHTHEAEEAVVGPNQFIRLGFQS